MQMQVLLSKKRGDQNHQNTDRGSKADFFTHTNTYTHTHTLTRTDRLNPDRRSIDKVFRESGVLKKEKHTGQTTREEGTPSLCPRTLPQCEWPLPSLRKMRPRKIKLGVSSRGIFGVSAD